MFSKALIANNLFSALVKTKVLFAVLLLPFLSGCALLQPTDPYAPIQTRAYSTGAYAPAMKASRNATAVDHPLLLSECLELALANNPRVAQSYWKTAEAAAQRDAAVGERWPSVNLQGGYSQYLDDQRLVGARAPGEPGAWSSDRLSTDVVVSMPLFTGGRIVNRIRASELLTKAAENQLARTRRELVFNVSSVFHSILGQRRVIESLEFSKKTLEEHRQRVQDLVDAQKAARVDVLRTEVRLADLEQKLVRQRNVLTIQRQTLLNLLGVDSEVDQTLEIAGDLSLQDFDGAEDALITAYSQRRDYQAVRAELEARAKAVDAERADRWPTISLAGSYGGRWAAGDTVVQPGAEESEDVGSVGLTVSVPLFEGGRINADIRRERAKLAAAQASLRELELGIKLEVQTALANVQSGRERVRATETSISQARESLRIEREKYDLGKGSITDVLDAQSALLAAETNHAQALAEHNVAVAQYRLAVGEQ